MSPLSAREANRAPSAAASNTVLRTCRARASWMTASVRTVSRDTTITNSATTEPRSREGRSAARRARSIRCMVTSTRGDASDPADPGDGLLKDTAEGGAREAPDYDHKPGRHEGNQNPAGNIAGFVVPALSCT